MEIKALNKINLTENALLENNIVIVPASANCLKGLYSILPGLEKALIYNPFKAKRGEVLSFNSLGNFKRVILIGIGEDFSALKDTYSAMDLGGIASKYINKEDEELSLFLAHLKETDLVKQLALCLLTGIRLKVYNFTKYFTKAELKDFKLSKINVLTSDIDISEELEKSNALVEGIYFTRDLVIEPANKMFSGMFAERVKEIEDLGVEIEVLRQADLEELQMGALLSVNQASNREPKVAILKWINGGDSSPLAFVGKGVTFDSGGLSLKPAGAMIGMKGDMAGAATVAGLFKTLALRKAKVNAIGVVGLVENLVSSNATKPGDVVTSYSGKTIEVLNTDAEGRLVLADVLSYTQDRFKPQCIIDLATLTGAIIITLGHLRAGLFSNDEDLASKLMQAGEYSKDLLWNLPVTDEYRPMMNSDIADIANIPTSDKGAGSVTAAVFLKEFIKDVKWAHLDIAGVAWRSADTNIGGKGASGFGVRLLDSLVSKFYESK